ncbi:MAG: DUF3311 domain-containing protein [Acidobacteriota bacterium]|nr:DUF3311 domain-containing protein [Acidobacteriota bacterium]
MRKLVIVLVVLLMILHQDFWLWDSKTLVFGFMPIGLAYHAAYCLVTAFVGWLAVKYFWPHSVDDLLVVGNGEERQ